MNLVFSNFYKKLQKKKNFPSIQISNFQNKLKKMPKFPKRNFPHIQNSKEFKKIDIKKEMALVGVVLVRDRRLLVLLLVVSCVVQYSAT